MNLFEPLQPSGPAPVGAAALPPGAMLEDFEITQVLGLTSFGVLYLATRSTDGSMVALKEYLPASIARRNADGWVEPVDPSHEEAFRRGLHSFAGEALALSQFDHPNLLQVRCVWEANGTVYRAMPFLAGNTLLARRSTATEPAAQLELLALFEALLGALHLLNSSGLAHGHVEPLNIFIADGQRPVLMDFNAVHKAVQSDPRVPHVDAYADTARFEQLLADDLHAVAAVLHFAISGYWPPSQAAWQSGHEPLADVLLRLKDSASALGYEPDFLSAIDAALALAPEERPRSVTEFRALFLPKAGSLGPAPMATAVAPPISRAVTHNKATPAQTNEYPLNPSETVLALLANFNRPAADTEDDIEHFEAPAVPTLTEEAEPSLPPMRASLFDALDAGDPLPRDPVGYGRAVYTPMPPIPLDRWRRMAPALVFGALVLGCLGALGWVLVS